MLKNFIATFFFGCLAVGSVACAAPVDSSNEAELENAGQAEDADETETTGESADALTVGAGKACGGIVGATCKRGLSCAYKDGVCGRGDQTGICAAKPTICTQEIRPVCGCNGRTYNNPCKAKAAGTSVAKQGACR